MKRLLPLAMLSGVQKLIALLLFAAAGFCLGYATGLWIRQ